MSYKKRGLGRGFSNFLSKEQQEEITSEFMNDSDLNKDDSNKSNKKNIIEEKNNSGERIKSTLVGNSIITEKTTPLISEDNLNDVNNTHETNNFGLKNIAVELITANPDQPRKYFDEDILRELSKSIEELGVLQPLMVRPMGNRFFLIAGERRLRASIMAGLKEVPCIVADVSDFEADKISIIENVQREDLSPIEEARAYRNLIENYGMFQDEVGDILGKSRQFIGNRIRLLKLPEEVQNMIEAGELTYSHGQILLSLENEEDMLREANRIKNDSITVTTMRRKRPRRRKEVVRDKYLDALLEKMSSHLGTKIDSKGTGAVKKLEIEYYSDEDLERIASIIMGGDLD